MSQPLAAKRLLREIRYIEQNAPPGISCVPRQEDNLMLWDAVISCPGNTIWEGGRFKLTLEFPAEYPFKPPKVRFVSRMFHPNVLPRKGNVFIDILDDNWSAAYTIVGILLSIQSLLADPYPNSPANESAGRLFNKTNKSEYNSRVKEIVRLSISN